MNEDQNGLTPFAKGAICANMAWLTVWPADVVKTQRQSGNYDEKTGIVSLLQEGLKSHPDQLTDWMISEARRRFVAAQPDLPPVTPPLLRGHIGYGHY